MPIPSDLIRLPPLELASLSLEWLEREGRAIGHTSGGATWLVWLELEEAGALELVVIALPGPDTATQSAFVREAWTSFLREEERVVTRRRAIDLRRGNTKPERLFPDELRDTPLEVLRIPDLVEALHQSALAPALAAWTSSRRALADQAPEHQLLVEFLSAELEADQFTRLNAAGGDKQRRTRLARVFVDLRVGAHRDGQEEDAPRFVKTLLSLAAPPSVQDRNASVLLEMAVHDRASPGARRRVVLVGGPGQGKTTLGIYLCQVYRAALLDAYGTRLSEIAREVVDELRASGGSGAVMGRRLPLRVVLHQYAAQLARGDVHDLWSYLTRYAQKRMGHPKVTEETLRSWLHRWPSLIVLDGLDEVPVTANRDQVLSTVHQALSELERANADIVVVATTRPQGYRGELPTERWRHLTLQDLSPDEATSYANLLLQEWVRADRVRRDELLERVQRAVRDVGTSQLATSPLQVTILTILIEQVGRPPRDRWRLFREYFRIIYDRERERGIPAVEVLTEQRELIEQLHAEVGYRLHLANERARGTEAGLSPADLTEIIRELLVRDDHQEPTLSQLLARVREAAEDRLVFLVGTTDQRIGFEIRSLQEFFAAERLFWGEESLLPRRLEAVAAGTHWRNVLRFAVGRIAAERPHLLDRIPALCDVLDRAEGGLGAQARLGARLAVDLLGEGSVGARPRLREALARRALDGLGELDGGWAADIAANLGTSAKGELVALLEHDLGPTHPTAWKIALRWAAEGDAAARKLVEARVAESAELVGDMIYSALWDCNWDAWWEGVFRQQVSRFHLRTARFLSSFWESRNSFVSTLPERHAFDELFGRFGDFVPGTGSARPMWAEMVLLSAPWDPMEIPSAHPSWAALSAVQAFRIAPSAQRLRTSIEAMADCDRRSIETAKAFAPWPLAALMQGNARERARLATLAGDGVFGDLLDWSTVEARWSRRGIRLDDLCNLCSPELPLTPKLIEAGLPYGIELSYINDKIVYAVAARSGADALRRLLLSAFEFDDNVQSIPVDHAFWAQLSTLRGATATEMLARGILSAPEDARWLPLLAKVARTHGAMFSPIFNADDSQIERLIRSILATLAQIPDLLFALVAILEILQFDLRQFDLRATAATAAPPNADAHLSALTALVHAANCTPADAAALAERLLDLHPHIDNPWSRLSSILRIQRPPGAVELLRQLLTRLPESNPALLRALHDLLSSRPAPLHHPALAADLLLPCDLDDVSTGTCSSAPSLAPVHLASLHLSDLRAWQNLEFTFKPASDKGQWLFFVGENGTGKTTLLRALALALVGPGTAQRFLGELPGSMVRTGQSSGKAAVTLSDGQQASLTIRGDQILPNGPPPELLVVGYGPRRGTLLGVTRQELNFSAGEAVETLFIEGGNLIHAKSWLLALDHRALRSKGGLDTAILDAVKRLLITLLPGVDEISIDADEVRVRGAGVGDVPLGAVSDGYLTTAGWVIDLVARWMERERVAGRAPGPGFAAEMTGLVLIDEIDLHLHPRWQWSLVDDLRRLFPRLSFVVTTHNPITLQGARPGEIYVIGRDETGRLRALQRDIAPGTGVEEVLTGAVFGLPSALDRDTAHLLDEHRELLRTAPQSPRRVEVEAELRRRLGRFADTSLEGIAQSVVAEVLRGDAESLSPQERQQARDRAREVLRRMKAGGRP